MTAKYTANVGADNARWLACSDSPLAETGGALSITDNGDGTITTDDFALGYLRDLPDDCDGCVSMSEGEVEVYDRIWIKGVGYELTRTDEP
jgi:hypothetical protein